MPAPTTVELLWGTAQRPKRGPKPALTLAGIVAEAIALVDAEGLAALSMQRLAERLGFTKMSLYRYVPGKEQLTALMLDTAMGEAPRLDGASWRSGLRQWIEAIFARYRAHPWTIELTLGIRPLGPNEMGWTEAAVAALAGTGLTGPERLDTIVLLNGHARSLAQQVESVGDGDGAIQFAEQFTAMMAAAGGRFPAVEAAFAEEAAAVGAGAAPGAAFDYGVDRILDGLAVLIDRRATSG
ncbi:TetR/AcrR family transcriptional regulator [Nocardia asteroides]|uniref:TetR family transcriptional regulator n=1 Tax=Nocardia asteroides NBRC 15531 TaxID=1110697 RepID=U5EC29_NOCAS|nr:TetR/AcrR family transcriptional regulator [Nocardia asteroides]TLF69989.1 TetR/AcrR family transcriptional regulator [Nocardia asteroides NBRC 15531]UGT49509.1 TetR/AcrR family transcriptional regulator [Nocardia asteroides]SFL92911.1 transcriptional regulator, TetR family [Nocardia asteroides]VEG37883.1 Tetracyclin repressor, C-terminal all-alpha domain [Nocardia asteroides]GAD82709.1 putative TetR family transcriptional regulator [Nocardia asteroides NBRC 15531]